MNLLKERLLLPDVSRIRDMKAKNYKGGKDVFLYTVEVTGSSPVSPTIKNLILKPT